MQVTFSPISSTSSRPIQKFTGTYVEKLNQPVAGTKVFKDAKLYQLNAFVSYIKSDKYKLGMTKADVENLSKFEGLDFINNSYVYLLGKLDIPQDVAPAVFISELANTDSLMMYVPSQNIIYISPKVVETGVIPEMFKGLRHELQHYLQNMQVFRHEKLGEQAIDAYSAQYMKIQKMAFENLYKNDQIPLLLADPNYPENEKEMLIEYMALANSNDQKGIAEFFDNMNQDYRVEFEKFRQKAINAFGEIKSDSKEASDVEQIYKEFSELGYFKPNNEIDYQKYFQSYIEYDALMAQHRADFEFSTEPCFMRFANKDMEKLLENPKAMEDLNSLNILV